MIYFNLYKYIRVFFIYKLLLIRNSLNLNFTDKILFYLYKYTMISFKLQFTSFFIFFI